MTAIGRSNSTHPNLSTVEGEPSSTDQVAPSQKIPSPKGFNARRQDGQPARRSARALADRWDQRSVAPAKVTDRTAARQSRRHSGSVSSSPSCMAERYRSDARREALSRSTAVQQPEPDNGLPESRLPAGDAVAEPTVPSP